MGRSKWTLYKLQRPNLDAIGNYEILVVSNSTPKVDLLRQFRRSVQSFANSPLSSILIITVYKEFFFLHASLVFRSPLNLDLSSLSRIGP